MSQTLGANGNELTLVIPSALERDWATSIRDNCFQKISDHNHTGSGNGKKLIAADSIDSASAWVANNVFIKSKNAAGNSTVDLIKANASDLVEIGTLIASMSVKSGGLSIKDSTDITKILQLDVSAISTATTRTLTLPNSNVDLGALVNANISASASIALSKLAALTANKLLVSDASGVISASSVTDTEAGYLSGVTSAIQTQINAKQASDATLTALAAYNTNGLIAQTAADTFAGRTITGTASEIDVSNGDGVSGNPTIGISDNPVLPGTGSVTLPSGTTAQRSGSPVAGMVRYNSDLTRFEGYKGGAWGEIGGGSAGINYIEDKDAEAGIGSWATYADAAGSNAVDGTGGSPNITFTQNSSSPLRGTNDFKLAKDAANRQGEGASYDFTIEKADLSKKLYISFDYDASSANYADNDIRVQVYDVTNGVLIRCNGEDLKAGKNSHLAWFQADATSTSYRLILHVSSTNASAYDVYLDNIQVGPREVSLAESHVRFAQGAGNAGTVLTANTTNIDFTSTYSLDSSWNGTTFTAPHNGTYIVSGNVRFTGAIDPVISFYVDGTVRYGLAGNVGSVQSIAISGSIYLNKGEALTLRSNTGATLQNNTQLHNIIISGPSPRVASEDIGNRDIRVRGAGNAGTVLTASVTPMTFTEVEDTTASWDGSTFTVPETGDYHVSGNVRLTGAADIQVQAFVNGSLVFPLGGNYGSQQSHNFGGTIRLTKGDLLTIRSNTNVTLSNSTTLHTLHILKMAQPQTVLETEVVAARYTSNSGQSITTSTTVMEFEDKVYDTHGAYNTSTGVYTVPVTGYYQVNSHVTKAETDTSVLLRIYNNGSELHSYYSRQDSSGVTVVSSIVSGVFYLTKGDSLDIRATCGVNGTLNANGAFNSFSIARIK